MTNNNLLGEQVTKLLEEEVQKKHFNELEEQQSNIEFLGHSEVRLKLPYVTSVGRAGEGNEMPTGKLGDKTEVFKPKEVVGAKFDIGDIEANESSGVTGKTFEETLLERTELGLRKATENIVETVDLMRITNLYEGVEDNVEVLDLGAEDQDFDSLYEKLEETLLDLQEYSSNDDSLVIYTTNRFYAKMSRTGMLIGTNNLQQGENKSFNSRFGYFNGVKVKPVPQRFLMTGNKVKEGSQEGAGVEIGGEELAFVIVNTEKAKGITLMREPAYQRNLMEYQLAVKATFDTLLLVAEKDEASKYVAFAKFSDGEVATKKAPAKA